jgi:hypothetical protein
MKQIKMSTRTDEPIIDGARMQEALMRQEAEQMGFPEIV